jgi:HPt (histidine-containing phosphotransfer) domain-containing protein
MGDDDSDSTVDGPAFAQLLAEVGPEVMARLLDAFAREASARIARFAELSAAGSPLGEGGDLHREVHSLKSAAASFGAAALAKRADELETAVEARIYTHDPAAAAGLETLFGRFAGAVAAHRLSPKTP